MCIYIYICIYIIHTVHACTSMSMHACLRTCKHAKRVCRCAYMYAHVSVYVYDINSLSLSLSIYNNMYIYIYIYIYTHTSTHLCSLVYV